MCVRYGFKGKGKIVLIGVGRNGKEINGRILGL